MKTPSDTGTKTDTKTAKKRATWPRVRFIEGRPKPWLVDTRIGGKGERLFYATATEADTKAEQIRIARKNGGTEAAEMPSRLRSDAIEAERKLAAVGKTIMEAVDFYLAHLAALKKSVPVEQAVAELIDLRRAKGRNAEYLRGLSIRLGRFAQDHAGVLMAEFDLGTLESWLAGLPHAPATVNTFRRDLVTLFSFSQDRSYCAENLAMKTDLETDEDKPPGILTIEQSSALLAACTEDVLPYVAIGLFAGIRTAELKKLDWREVDLVGGHIEVTAAKSKTRKRRLIPISENLAAWIRPLAQIAGPVAPVGLRKRFEAVRVRAGLKDWPQNALRHSFGSYRLAQIHDAARVSLEMGNSPAMVFAHYRELVKPADAAKFWTLAPAKSGKVLAMKAA